MKFLDKSKSRALKAIRRGDPVSWVPDWMGLGNILYQGLWAFEGDDRQEGRRVLLHPKREAAVALFPTLRGRYFVTRDRVPFTARRVMPWREESPEPIPYQPAALPGFIREVLLPGSPVAAVPDGLSEDDVVVNVRRGDYYSVPQHEAEFGMDQVAYVRAAISRAAAVSGPIGRIIVISDGLDWCRENLGPVLEPHGPVIYEDGDLFHDLRAIVHARRLVITNSTFSYWGGYIGDELHPGRLVIAPALFSHNLNGGRAHQLKPSWTVLEDGCWDRAR